MTKSRLSFTYTNYVISSYGMTRFSCNCPNAMNNKSKIGCTCQREHRYDNNMPKDSKEVTESGDSGLELDR
jgi:hypothetical protein